MKPLLALLLCVACTPNFDSVSQVIDLRVLAVQADPPEAQFDENGVDPVHIRVLAVDPQQRAPFTVAARACFPTTSRRCDEGNAIGPLNVSTDFTFTNIPPAYIQAALQNDDLKGLNGLRLQLELSVASQDPHGPVVAEKIVVFSKRGTTPNHLPVLDRIDLSVAGEARGSVLPGQTLQLQRGVEVGLRPVLAAGSRETYQTTDLNGNALTFTEQPRYAFFAQGDLDIDRDTADEPIDGVAPPDGLTRLTALKAGAGKLWVVVRDGRGGESWMELPVTMQ